MEKFEVGDKVRLTKLDTNNGMYASSMNNYLGQIGTVQEKGSGGYIAVDFGYSEGSFYYPVNWLELVERKKEGWTGQVVCTSLAHPCGEFFTPGKVYDVKDGYLIDKTGTPYTPLQFNSINELIHHFGAYRNYRFVEFKGFNDK